MHCGSSCPYFLIYPISFFLVGGCLLLWLNLGAPREEVVPTIRADPDEGESVEPAVQLFENKEISELRAENGATLLDTAPSEERDANADAVSTDQNHYASSVSAAIAKSRKSPASV
jgi:hypothetical protein